MFFSLIILPLLIFTARICDVSIGTFRIILVGRGHKILAPLLGFFEVLVWLIAIQQIMQNLTNTIYYFAYAAGFAAGNYVGMLIEEKIALGILVIRIITNQSAEKLIEKLRQQDYGATSIDATGKTGPVNVLYTVIRRADLKKIITLINDYHPNAFYSVEDVKLVREGIFPAKSSILNFGNFRNLLKFRRKKK
ncbi:MAG: hypothetical protein APR63_11035 [Desulfuromonas sp. SDB]|nr:MAG: hypothetical protein APR63_11035 [Desulfuromonas sp. SDB]